MTSQITWSVPVSSSLLFVGGTSSIAAAEEGMIDVWAAGFWPFGCRSFQATAAEDASMTK